MIGAIAGDIIGSCYEHQPIKTTNFPLFSQLNCFTDDTVCTVALAESFLTGEDYADLLRKYVVRYPNAGYGWSFYCWAQRRKARPYNSWGNGSAMRVSPIGFAASTLQSALDYAKRSAEITHNHPDGIKGAQATTAAIYLARTGASKAKIKTSIEQTFGYDLSQPLQNIIPIYKFDVSCSGSVPQAIIAFLEAEDYESAVRNAVALGGDSDTQACIAGGIAQAFYGIPSWVRMHALEYLDDALRAIVLQFEEAFPPVR